MLTPPQPHESLNLAALPAAMQRSAVAGLHDIFCPGDQRGVPCPGRDAADRPGTGLPLHPRGVVCGAGTLSHCLEAYANANAHPLVDLFALEGIGLVSGSLRAAFADGADLAARERMCRASLYGGLCLGPLNTAAAHALAYPLGGEFHVPHGLSVALLLPHVMEFCIPAAPERYAAIARALGAEPEGEASELARAGVRRLRDLMVAVCGLNPHAGESGLFGRGEEEPHIRPAIEQARRRGLEVDGPLPPDAAFVPERARRYGAIVCMYHDQGHIPFKMVAFDTGVNITLGLPIVRVSVDHGTAFDIAWQGRARATSMRAAILCAARMGGSA